MITDSDMDEVLELIREGYSTHYIAHRFKTTRGAVQYRLTTRGIQIPAVRAQVLFPPRSLRAVAQLFDVQCTTVTQWVKRGCLAATRERRLPNRPHYTRIAFVVSEFAILDFLTVRAAWMTYDPARITDPHIREEAQRLRAEAGGDWVLLADYVRSRGYDVHASHRWVRGGLPAVQYGRAYYVWSTDLAQFSPPRDNRIKEAPRQTY